MGVASAPKSIAYRPKIPVIKCELRLDTSPSSPYSLTSAILASELEMFQSGSRHSEDFMKKALLLFAITAITSISAFGGACSATTDVQALNNLGGTGCTFGGLLFTNFFFSGYNDTAYGNSATYQLTQINPVYTAQTNVK